MVDGILENQEIYIHNPDDMTEITVKRKLAEGRVYSSWNEIYKIIGCNLLGQKNLDGGVQKKKAKKYLLQYARFETFENKKSLLCAQIYNIPIYDESLRQDNRGKKGIYIDKMIPIFLDYLMKKEENEWFTFVKDMAQILGLVNEEYKKYDEKEMRRINPDFTPHMVNKFYFFCGQHLEREIFLLLDRMEKEYKLLEYRENFRIVTVEGAHVSNKEEEKIIAETEKYVLDEMKIKNKRSLIWKNRKEKYYRRVYQVFKEKYKLNWIKYYRQIQIKKVNREELNRIAKSVLTEENNIEELRNNLSFQFANKIYSYISNRFETQRREADEKIIKLKKEYRDKAEYKFEKDEKCQDLRDLVDLCVFKREDVINSMAEIPKKEMPYKECDRFMEIQSELIAMLIATPRVSQSMENKDIA